MWFPFSTPGYILKRFPLFFWQKRRKRKANKRKTPQGGFRALRGATNAPRVGSAPPFGKGLSENFKRHRRGDIEWAYPVKSLCLSPVYLCPTWLFDTIFSAYSPRPTKITILFALVTAV